jgi:hypothetical protein
MPRRQHRIAETALLRVCLCVLLVVLPVLSPPSLAALAAVSADAGSHHPSCHDGAQQQTDAAPAGETPVRGCPHCTGDAAITECQCCAAAIAAMIAPANVSNHLQTTSRNFPATFVPALPAAPRQPLYRPPIPFA